MRSALVALGILAVGCASTPPKPAATADTPDWRELRSAHFVVRTDADDDARLVRYLEGTYAVVETVLPPRMSGQARSPIPAVAFRSRAELREFAPVEATAYVHHPALCGVQIVFAFGEGGTAPFILAKEVARVVMLRELPGQPRWFALGAPAYVAATAVGLRAGPTENVLAGPYRRARDAGLRLRQLLSGEQPVDGKAWELAWPMIDYLAEAHPERLADAIRRIPTAPDPARVFPDVFPEWSPTTEEGPERLEAAIEAYVAAVRTTPRVRVSPPDAAFTSRSLLRAEARALRLALPRGGADRAAADAARVADAIDLLQEVPSHPLALSTLVTLRNDEHLSSARRAVEGHPGSAFAWAFLADALETASSERIAAERKVLELEPDACRVANNLAWDLMKKGRHDEALWLATRAVSLAPWNAPALDTLAAIYDALGYCPDALMVQRRALEYVLTQRGPTVSDYRERVARLEARCGTATR